LKIISGLNIIFAVNGKQKIKQKTSTAEVEKREAFLLRIRWVGEFFKAKKLLIYQQKRNFLFYH
jgi:hypothetical protein